MGIVPSLLWRVFSDLCGWDICGRGSVMWCSQKICVQHSPNQDVWLLFNRQGVFFKANRLVSDVFGLCPQVYSLQWGSRPEYFWMFSEELAKELDSCFEASAMFFETTFNESHFLKGEEHLHFPNITVNLHTHIYVCKSCRCAVTLSHSIYHQHQAEGTVVQHRDGLCECQWSLSVCISQNKWSLKIMDPYVLPCMWDNEAQQTEGLQYTGLQKTFL